MPKANVKRYSVDDLDTNLYSPGDLFRGRHGDPKTPWFELGYMCALMGPSKSGKTYFLRWFMYEAIHVRKKFKWGLVVSGSANVSNDWVCFDEKLIQRDRDVAKLRAIYETCYQYKEAKIKEKLKKKRGRYFDRDKINLPPGVIIEDDQIGTTHKSTALKATAAEKEELYGYISTQARRLDVTYFQLAQYPTLYFTVQRDNFRYILVTKAAGESLDYVYKMVNRDNLWQRPSEFRDWATKYLNNWQLLFFDTQANDPRDIVRIVKAPAEEPPHWKWKCIKPQRIQEMEKRMQRMKEEQDIIDRETKPFWETMSCSVM